MKTFDQLQREIDCSIQQCKAVNFALSKTYKALSRYDPTRNAAEERADEPEEDDVVPPIGKPACRPLPHCGLCGSFLRIRCDGWYCSRCHAEGP